MAEIARQTPLELHRPDDLTLETFEEIVWGGRPLSLHPDLLDAITTSRTAMMEALADGRSVYGINTGMGYLSKIHLDEDEQQRHQANLLLGRAVGGPPYLESAEARALLLARLAGFLSGHAGVTPALCQFLADRLNNGFVPAIPRRGTGSAGEIIPLAHAFQTFLGIGWVIAPDGALQAASVALAERGVPPYRPQTKEGIALLAGAPGTLALAIARHRSIRILARQLLVAAACAIDALRAPLLPYDPAVADLAADPLMANVLTRLGRLLAGSDPDRPVLQAPVSYRVVPQVLTHLERTLARVEEDIRRGLKAVGDSPAFVAGAFISTGAFHAIDLATDMDVLCMALAQAGELAGQHIHRLLDHRFSGLPDQLTPLPGPHAGLIAVHKRVVGAVNELRRLAAPATVGLADTSLGQEDAMTFAYEAADKLRRAEQLSREIIACALLTARQSWTLRPAPPADGLQPYVTALADAIPPVDRDRPLGGDIETLIALLRTGAFS